MRTYTIDEIKLFAKGLICTNAPNELGAEYNRGICELIADFDGIEGVEHSERSYQVAKELGCSIVPFVNVGNAFEKIEGETLGEMNHLREQDTER